MLTAAVLTCLPILLGLGVWQVKRLAWKTDLLARVEAARTAPPRQLASALSQVRGGRDVDFVRVETVCLGLSRAPWVELHALREGQGGVRLISACRTPHGTTILVDRGFVADIISARPPADASDHTPVRITGVLRKADPASPFVQARPATGSLWLARDARAMAAALGVGVVPPVFLVAETSSNPEWLALRAEPLPGRITNNHLGYALTWFGLAAALLGVYGAMLAGRRRRRPPRADAGHDSL